VIRVYLPQHLRTLAKVSGDVFVEAPAPATLGGVLDAIEAHHPVLVGTIRDRYSKRRRPFVRYFVCEEDWSHREADALLPEAVARGEEPFLVIGATAGG